MKRALVLCFALACRSGGLTEAGTTCVSSDTCAAGSVCVHGACQKVCAENGDCESGFVCSEGACASGESCGDGVLVSGEACDDGNELTGDGCAGCQVESGWSCDFGDCGPIHGDGVTVGAEECDDGDALPGDGCDAGSRIEPGWSCAGQPSACLAAACDDDLDCESGAVCNAGSCGAGLRAGAPLIASVDGDGPASPTVGAAHVFEHEILVEGTNLAGARLALLDSGGRRIDAEVSSSSDTLVALCLPSSLAAGDYTLSVANQAGACSATLPVLRGLPGTDGLDGAAGRDGADGQDGADGASPFVLNGTNAYYTAGHVSIGTTDGRYPFQVAGTATFNGTAGRGVLLAPVVESDTSGVMGVHINPAMSPLAEMATIYGNAITPDLTDSAADITAYYANYFRADTRSSYTGDVAQIHVVRIAAPSFAGTGTISLLRGLTIEDMEGATSEWGIYQIGEDDPNYFGGRVSIGTTSGPALLHVRDPAATFASEVELFRLSAQNGRSLRVLGPAVDNTTSPFTLATANTLNVRVDTTDVLYATSTGGGRIGVGTSTPGARLQVGNSGDGSVALANSWNTFSDGRLKTGLTRVSNALGKVSSLNGYYYYWKEGADRHRQVGIVAQEVEEVLPEIVSETAGGVKTVEYSKLSAVLIEAVKDLQAENRELKARLDAIEARLAK
jgi:cysteine-rich repeat protein